ncbi:DUF4328 domain-containing protein [Streptomyces roseochromogenus]|uniref:DUF4328 domain-containing protein n=1 Tax=Streptomyces roseochromogenus subsp. oscitans DS 12.976 TaxID=1352936 RepID=V6KAC5_STRRC|nr:DUF4328 domain-containing protein [Streptomyces roseochromogenus]EST29082.1 hypothetical protein M878_21405 [Streptomyces roseochromogenus subsp. oscitans DS 12.976]
MEGPQQGTSTGVSPAGTETYRPVTGAATAATLLISLELVREVLVAVHNWRDYVVVHDFLAGRATLADVEAADSGTFTTLLGTWSLFLVGGAAGVAFLVWLWRARINAELTGGAAAHRRSRGWVIGAWLSPVANLWFPYQVVSDIWQASAPRRPAPVALIKTWWVLYAVALFVVKPIQWRMASQEASEQDVLANANMSTLLTVLTLAAGVLVILIIRRVTEWQTNRPAQNAG